MKHVAMGLSLGCVAALCLRLVGWGTTWVASALGLSALVGFLWPRARQQTAPDVGAAAWALDRMGGHRERALTVALADDAVDHLAGNPLPPPPRIRLRPADGAAPLAGSLLLAGALVLAPSASSRRVAQEHAGDTARELAGGASSSAGDSDSGNERDHGKALATRAKTLDEVRRAAGLAPGTPIDRDAWKERLANPNTSRAVREAMQRARLENDTSLKNGGAQASASRSQVPGPEADDDAVATWLAGEDDAWHRAMRARRRQRAQPRRIPPSRRGMVARYLTARGSTDGDTPR